MEKDKFEQLPEKNLHRWSLIALAAAIFFECIILVHLWLFLCTGNPYGLLFSVECLYLLAWISVYVHNNIHQFLGRRFTVFSIVAVVVPYEIIKRLLLNGWQLDILSALPWMYLTIAEAVFVCMLLSVLLTRIKLSK